MVVEIVLFFFCWFSFSQSDEEMFLRYRESYNKKYSPRSLGFRFRAFSENLRTIDRLNSESPTGRIYGINEFSDLTPSEFRMRKLMMPQDVSFMDDLRASKEVSLEPRDVPDEWNWVDHGAVTPIKNQADCGSCWSFSTTGNIEGQWFLAGHSLTSLSEEELVECDHNQDCACLGGMPVRALEWLIKERNGKIVPESVYPYCVPPLGNCYPCVYNETWCGELYFCNVSCHDQEMTEVGAVVTDYHVVPKDEDLIKQYLYENGPLSVLIDASTLQYYHKGVWDPVLCSQESFDHAVLLVGYGTEKSLFGQKPYWIVKNSWGAKWGEKGFFRILRGKNKCGIAGHVVNAIVAK